jgi:hypothetical protein
MREINVAFDILSDPKKRQEYDESFSNGGGTFKNTHEKPESSSPKRESSPSSSSASGNSGYHWHEGYSICQTCRKLAPVHHVSFHQQIGAVILRFSRNVEGELCQDCVNHYFWSMTGVTLLLGWWGVISLFITPFVLLGNLFNYFEALFAFRSFGKTKPNSKKRTPMDGKKVAIPLAIALLTLVVLGAYLANRNNQTASPAPTSVQMAELPNNHVPNPALAGSTIDAPYPALSTPVLPTVTAVLIQPTKSIPLTTPTSFLDEFQVPEGCKYYQYISKEDIGKTLCVYGVVISAEMEDGKFVMRFSNSIDSPALWSNDGYFEDMKSNCVRYTGVIQGLTNERIGGIWGTYMVIGPDDHVYHC